MYCQLNPFIKKNCQLVLNSFIKGNYNCSFVNKKENEAYDTPVKYAQKSFGQSFVYYLSPAYFSSINIQYKKKHPHPRYAK